MTEQQIKAEHDRLRPILFDGAPEWFRWAAMDKDGEWWLFLKKPDIFNLFQLWATDSEKDSEKYSRLQPSLKTALHWTNTLVERGDA